MNKKDLLIEIGCEETPVDYILPALKQMEDQVKAQLKKSRLSFQDIKCEATPRRFVLMVKALDEKQETIAKELSGPKKAIAFKPDGSLTPAGEGFCKKAGCRPDQVSIKDDRLVASINDIGASTLDLLPAIINHMIKSTTFPKSMRWEASGTRFARPVRWLLIMFGNEIVPVSFADVKSSNQTNLHPLANEKRKLINEQSDYFRCLEKGFIMLSIKERQNKIQELLEQAAIEHKGQLVTDEELLSMVTMMTEWPGVVVGSIKPQFMNMPREIITTAMREHQRYFAIENEQGGLLPLFIMVHDNPTGQADSMRPGCERVLEARLKDAEFFYSEDMKQPIKEKVQQLERVRWIKNLGNLLDKTNRLKKISAWLAEHLDPDASSDAIEAAHLSKADLITNMIQEKEFNKLQGYMGGLYALEQGTKEAVATACMEQYQPRYAGDRLPGSSAGRILAMADRLDNLVGCWGAGFAPTGAKDPYALRRAAQGFIAITQSGGYRFQISEAINETLETYNEFENKEAIAKDIKHFIQGRLETELASRGMQPDLIQAVLNVFWDDITAVIQKAEAINNLRKKADFNAAVTTFSRVVNILPKGTERVVLPNSPDKPVDQGLFQEEIENKLYQDYEAIGQQITDLSSTGSYQASFEKLYSLKEQVDQFFDQVMVMDKNEDIKNNRLHLLTNLARKIWSIADFSKLVIK